MVVMGGERDMPRKLFWWCQGCDPGTTFMPPDPSLAAGRWPHSGLIWVRNLTYPPLKPLAVSLMNSQPLLTSSKVERRVPMEKRSAFRFPILVRDR